MLVLNQKSYDLLEVENKPDTQKVAMDNESVMKSCTSNGCHISRPKLFLYTLHFFLYGINSLLPWNSFSANTDQFIDRVAGTNLAQYIVPTVSLLSMIPLVIMYVINMLFLNRFDGYLRIMFASVLLVLGFIATIVIFYVNITPLQFFIGIVCITFELNLASPIIGSAYYGEVSYFPMSCLTSYLAGQSFAGIAVTVIRLGVTAISSKSSDVPLICFSLSLIILLASIIAYIVLAKTHDYSNFKQQFFAKASTGSKISESVTFLDTLQKFRRLFVKNWQICVSMFVTLAGTLAIWPHVPLQIKSAHSNTIWAIKYFVTVTCFLSFNIADFLGRYTAAYIPWPKPNSIFNVLLAFLRTLLLLPLLFCNRDNTKSVFKPYISLDVIPMLIVFVFALINGHLIAVNFSGAYKLNEGDDIKATSDLLLLLLSLGLAAGAGMSYAVQLI